MYILTVWALKSSHPARHRIRPLAVKNLVRPKHHDQFVFAHIGDVVNPAGDSLDNQRLIAGAVDLIGLIGEKVAEW